MLMQQVQLVSGNSRMVCWIPRDPRWKLGSILSLEKVEGRWQVAQMYSLQELSEIPRGWQVGGL